MNRLEFVSKSPKIRRQPQIFGRKSNGKHDKESKRRKTTQPYFRTFTSIKGRKIFFKAEILSRDLRSFYSVSLSEVFPERAHS